MKRSILAIALLAVSSIALAGGHGQSSSVRGGSYSSYSSEGNATYAVSGVQASAGTFSGTNITAGPNTQITAINGALAVSGGVSGASAQLSNYCRTTQANTLTGGVVGSLSVTGGYVNVAGDNGSVTSVNEAAGSATLYADAGAAEWDLSGRHINKFWLNTHQSGGRPGRGGRH